MVTAEIAPPPPRYIIITLVDDNFFHLHTYYGRRGLFVCV